MMEMYGCGSAPHHINTFFSDAKALQPVAPGHEAPQNQILEEDAVWGLPRRSTLRPPDELTTLFLVQEHAEVLDQHRSERNGD